MGVSVSAAIVRLRDAKAAGEIPAAFDTTSGRAELTGGISRWAATALPRKSCAVFLGPLPSVPVTRRTKPGDHHEAAAAFRRGSLPAAQRARRAFHRFWLARTARNDGRATPADLPRTGSRRSRRNAGRAARADARLSGPA